MNLQLAQTTEFTFGNILKC